VEEFASHAYHAGKLPLNVELAEIVNPFVVAEVIFGMTPARDGVSVVANPGNP
jgi:hypothetical protein